MIFLFAAGAACYAIAFCAYRQGTTPIDWTQFWGQAFLPERIVANWFGNLAEQGATLGILDRLPIVSTSVLVWSWAWSLGRLLLRAIGLDRNLFGLEKFVLAAGVGANLLSLYVLCLGLAAHLQRGWLCAPLVVATLSALAVEFSSARRRQVASAPSSEPPQAATRRRDWLPALASAVFVLAILAGALLPTRDFDVLEYHLQAPKEFYAAGRIDFLAHNVYANMPLGAEMFSLANMVVLGDWWPGGQAGQLAIAMYAPLTALALVAFGRRWLSPLAGSLAALCYISIPWVAMVSVNGLVEGASAFYLIASLYALLLWRDELLAERHGLNVLVLVGLLAGGAVSIKYPAVVFVVLPLTIAIWMLAGGRWLSTEGQSASGVASYKAQQMSADKNVHQRYVRTKALGVFFAAVVIACGPWLVKNLVLSGNPVYPLAYRWFDGSTCTPEKDAQWRRAHGPPNFSPGDFGQRVAGLALTSPWISPIVAPLAVLALFSASRRLALALAGYMLFVFLAWWLLTHRLDRFWVPLLPVLALLAGLGATWSVRPAWRRTLAVWMTIGLAYNLFVLTSGTVGDSRYFVSLDELRAEVGGLQPAHAYLDHHVSPGDKVLLVGDATPYDLSVPAIYNTVFDSSIFEQIAHDRSPAEIAAALAELRISYVYVNWSEIARYRSPGNYGFTSFVRPAVFARLTEAGVLEQVFADDDGRGVVYRVNRE